MSRRSIRGLLTLLALTPTAVLAAISPADADAVSMAARIMPGSAELTLVTSKRLPDGDYETRWRGADSSADIVAPAGTWVYEVPAWWQASAGPALATPRERSYLTRFIASATAAERDAAASTGLSYVGTLMIVPPGAMSDAMASGRARAASRRPNPPDHSWFNSQSSTFCYGLACTKASGRQYTIQEQPGQWFIGSYISASGYGGGPDGPIKNAKTSYASAFSKWPGEHGDVIVSNSPTGTTYTSNSSRTVGVSLSDGGFGFNETWTLGSHSSYGPNWAHGTENPAFGAQWHGCSTGSTADYEDVSSADVNHLGRGQSPYDSLIEQANYNNC
ncbi:MAG: hypothetical protein ACLPY3_09215 [Solirubrobacteraceae bacterium]